MYYNEIGPTLKEVAREKLKAEDFNYIDHFFNKHITGKIEVSQKYKFLLIAFGSCLFAFSPD